jgi:tetratricopeptide (TPR) repeat protein
LLLCEIIALHFRNIAELNKSPVYITIMAFLMLFLTQGCSVQKNTGLSRTYHEMTARFNVLFNGTQSFNKGTEKIDEGFRDDFADVLPIFPFTSKNASLLASSDMDRAIKKCEKLISMHSITVKPKVKNSKTLSPSEREFFNKKEYNGYVDDAYLLMGKSHFYKQEYTESSELFHRILNDFKGESVIPEAQIWLARLSVQTSQYKDAYEILNLLQNNAEFPKKLQHELYPSLADYYLSQKDYKQAVNYLQKSVSVEKKKKIRTRFLFILAQLCEKTGDLKQASVYYSEVIKLNPVYDMAFNARINRALAYQQGFSNSSEIESELLKMLRDDKNTEYMDQIYYALGNLAAKEGNNTKAIEYYKKSVQSNVNNEEQKTRSFLTLANLYYSLPDYPHAQMYYDSALVTLDPAYPGYDALFTKSKSLTRLVKELNTVQLEDSVLKLAKLPEAELLAKIDGIIESERKKAEAEQLRIQNEQLDRQQGNEMAAQNNMRQPALEGTRWYFYNDAAKSLGYREFKLNWGNRKLEDHWQRAIKSSSTFGGGDETETLESETAAPVNTFSKMSREYYTVNIPRTDSAVAASLKRIELALFNMGIVYKTDLKDLDKASSSFKELIRRYPQSDYLLMSYFNLYGIAKDQNNQAMVDYYKNIISGQFPESMYAKVLTNPKYIEELEEAENKVKRYYAETYDLYKAGNYSEVISRSQYAQENFSNNQLIPRFAYLGTLSAGKNADRKIFRENLLALISKYPQSDVASDAQNLIDYMDKEHPEIKEEHDIIVSKKLYQPDFDTEHLFAFIVDKKMNTNQLIFNIINFNLDNFDKLGLRVDISDLNPHQNLVLVKTFHDKNEAMSYLNAVRSSETLLKDIPGAEITPIIISSGNLNILKSDKSADLYLKFFTENYR